MARPWIVWTPEMIEALKALRREGKPLTACARRIGVGYNVLRRKAVELGLNGHISRGPLTGEERVAQRRGS